jgi:hypothetical protein
MKTVFVRRSVLIAAIVAVVAALSFNVVTMVQAPVTQPKHHIVVTWLLQGVPGLVNYGRWVAARLGERRQ